MSAERVTLFTCEFCGKKEIVHNYHLPKGWVYITNTQYTKRITHACKCCKDKYNMRPSKGITEVMGTKEIGNLLQLLAEGKMKRLKVLLWHLWILCTLWVRLPITHKLFYCKGPILGPHFCGSEPSLENILFDYYRTKTETDMQAKLLAKKYISQWSLDNGKILI